MEYVVLIVMTVAFVLGAHWLRLAPEARRVLALAVDASVILRDRAMADDAKEKAVQGAAKGLFRQSGVVLLRTVAALAAPLAVVPLVETLNLAPHGSVQALLLSWQGILAGSVAFLLMSRALR